MLNIISCPALGGMEEEIVPRMAARGGRGV